MGFTALVRRHASAALLVAFAVIAALVGAIPSAAHACPVAPVRFGYSANSVEMAFPNGRVRLLVADNWAAQERGLMCVRSVPQDGGMVFVFPVDAEQGLWMKNTTVPLDMVWVSALGFVTKVAADVPASPEGMPDAEVARRAGDGRVVIELAGGSAERLGVKKGVFVALPRLLEYRR